jgi:hypothetical protein
MHKIAHDGWSVHLALLHEQCSPRTAADLEVLNNHFLVALILQLFPGHSLISPFLAVAAAVSTISEKVRGTIALSITFCGIGP